MVPVEGQWLPFATFGSAVPSGREGGGHGDEHEENLCDECWCKYQDKKGGAA